MNLGHRASLVVASIVGWALGCMCPGGYETTEPVAPPTDLQLVSGDFPRRGEDLLRWSVSDRSRRIQDSFPGNPARWDELAEAWTRLGDKDAALDVMRRKRAAFGASAATMTALGEAFFRAGRLEDALPRLDSAIALRRRGEAGREVHLRLLIEYVLARRRALPLDTSAVKRRTERGFAAFLAWRLPGGRLGDEERRIAIHDVLGMMLSGEHQSPMLLEAWADLQLVADSSASIQRAALGYLQASRRTEGERSRAYRRLAQDAAGETLLPAVERLLDGMDAMARNRMEGIAFIERGLLQARTGTDLDSAWVEHFLKEKVTRAPEDF